jgi:hypothetical protein
VRGLSLGLCVVAACATPLAASPPSATADAAHSPSPRQPPGVYLDVAPALPEAHDRVEAGGMVTLAPGVASDEAVALARSFFRALLSSDAAALRELVSPQMNATDAATLERHTDGVAQLHLSVDTVAALDAARVGTFESAPRALRDEAVMQAGDVVVVVPIKVERPAGSRLFGPRVLLVLRRDSAKGGYRIVRVVDDDGE